MAYRAEIEIGVKGGKEISALQDKVERLTQALDAINTSRFSVAQRVNKLTSFQVAQEQKLIVQRQRFNDELRESVRLAVEFQQRIEASIRAAQSSRAVSSRTLTGSTPAGLIAASPEPKALPAAGGTGAGARAFERAAAKAARIDAFTKQVAEFLQDIDRQIEQRSNAIRQAQVSVSPGKPQPFGLLPPARTAAAQAVSGGSPVQQEVTAAKTVQNTLTRNLQIQKKINELKVEGVRLDKQLNGLTRAKLNAEEDELDILNRQIAQTRQLKRENKTYINELQQSLQELPAGGFVRGAASPLRGDRQLNANIRERTRLEQSLTNFKLQGLKVTAAETALEKLNLSLNRKDLNTTEQELKLQKELLEDLRQELRLVRQISDNRKGGLDGRTRAQKAKDAAGSALIGGAFPLLFGQGVGAAFGGAAGGFGGGLIGGQFGFGLSLVGTQIGTLFDQITNKSIELGKALDPVSGDLAAVADAAGLAGTNTKNLLQSLKGQISQTQAAELAADQLAVVIGEDGVNALRELGEASNELGREASKAFSAIAASLAPILTAVIEPITEEVSRGRLLSRAPELAASDPEIARLLEQRRGVATAGTKGVSGEALLIEEQLITLVRKREEAEKAAADAKLQGISTGRQELTILELQNKIKRLGTDLTDENNAYLEEAILRQKAANEEYKVGIAFASDEITKAEYINKIKVIREGLTGNILDLESRVTKEVERQAKAEERKKEQAAREAERVQKEAERAARATKALDIELRLLRVLTGQNIAIAEARRDGNSELVYTLQIDKELQRLAADTLKIKNENLSTEDEQLKINIAREKVAQRLNELEQAELDRKKNIEDAVNKNLRSIQNEIELSQARLAGIEEQTKLEQELATIKENIKGINDADLELIRQKLVLLQEQLASEKAIQEVRDIQKRTETAGAGLRAGFIGQAGQAFEQQLQQGSTKERATEIALLTKEMELAELQAQSLQNVVLGIGDAFATAMTTGVAELVAGTKSAEEVFSDFLKNVGNILLQTAQQMIATYIAIGIAKAFAGLSGGTTDMGSKMSNTQYFNPTTGLGVAGPNFGLANGGPAKAGQPYMVGERGPELFVPGTNGGVMRNEDMRQLMGRSPVGNAPAMNFTFETTNIGGQEFVSREQLEAAMVTTRRQAASDGAKRGMNMTLDRMQNSPRTRARVGIA